MLPFRLVRIAIEAEALRLSHKARRTVIRIILAYVAIVLLCAALAFVHLAAWVWLRQSLPVQYVALSLAGVDLLVAVVLTVLAMRSSPDGVELEALAVRRRALDDAVASMTISAMVIRFVEDWLMPRRRG